MKKTAGISLMLLIFLSLCLITFSLLSLSGATADSKLSQNSAERTTEYYAAVTAANGILAEIDTQLAACLREAEASENPEETYLDACAQITVDGVELTWTIYAEGTDSENHSTSDDGSADYKDDSVSDDSYVDYKDDSVSDDGSADFKDDSALDDSSVDSQDDSALDDGSAAEPADGRTSAALAFDIDITDTQYLHMELAIAWPKTGTDTLYQITSQKVISTQEWSADTNQNLYRTSENETE
ncbi:MAG: hypothetical protein LUG99_01825 [Lachnospiraceae bacterium]|nr:hypothetical protein [Lachnospiraceae bacterium]